MTGTLSQVLGLTLGLGLVGCGHAFAQPLNADSASTGPSSVRTFDAGVGTYAGRKRLNPGAWIGVGSRRWRLQVDYWYSEERSRSEPYYQMIHIVNQLDVAGVLRFRSDRSISPHVLGGVAFHRFRGSRCERNPYFGRRCELWRGMSVDPLWGAGIDVALGSRFVVRAQARAYVDPEAYFSALGRVACVVGAGVRF